MIKKVKKITKFPNGILIKFIKKTRFEKKYSNRRIRNFETM